MRKDSMDLSRKYTEFTRKEPRDGRHLGHDDPLRRVALIPPEKALLRDGWKVRRGCRGCRFWRDPMGLPFGKLPCESLTGYDLWEGEKTGQLQEMVWWIELPEELLTADAIIMHVLEQEEED